MEVKTVQSGGTAQVTVQGTVDTVVNAEKVRTEVNTAHKNNPSGRIELYFEDSFVIPSSLIGALMKLARMDGADIHVMVKDAQLFQLLDRLKLVELLNVQKI